MSCSCGDTSCNCLKRCFCSFEFCTCIICFNLRDVAAVKDMKENVSSESSPDTPKSTEIFESAKTDYYSDGEEILNTSSLHEEMQSDVFCIESSSINEEAEKYNSSSILFPEIILSDDECEIVFEKQCNSSVIECSAKEEDNFSGSKSDNTNLKTSTRRRKSPRYSSNNDPNYKCKRSGNKHRSEQISYPGFPKKTHITRFLERQHDWKIKDDDANLQTTTRRRKGFRYFSNEDSNFKHKRSWDNYGSRRNSYGLPRKTRNSQWRQWTLPTSGNSQVSANISHSDLTPRQHIRQRSRASTGHYPRLMVTVTLDTLSDNRVIEVNEDNYDVTECYTNKEDNYSEIKSDNANLQTSTRRRKGFRYPSDNDSDYKHTKSWNNHNHRSGWNSYHALPRKIHVTQFRKRPHASTGKCDNIAVSDNKDTPLNEDITEYSNCNGYFNQRSSSNIEHVNRNETTEKSSVSNPKFKRKSSDLQTSRYGLFTQEYRFHRKNRKASWNNPRLAQNDKEILPGKIEEGPSSFVGQESNLTSYIASEMPKRKDCATKSSTICGNCQKKMSDLTIDDFDENETRNLPDQNYPVYLNSRKCCVNNDNLGDCERNIYPTVNQRRHSEVNTIQNIHKYESDYETTRKNPSVSFLNPPYSSSSDMCNDYEENYSTGKKMRNRRRKKNRTAINGTARMNGTCPFNELLIDTMPVRKSWRRGRKYRRKTPSKQKNVGIETKTRRGKEIVKKEFFIKTEIKEEKP